METPAEFFIKEVPGHEDLVAFQYDFTFGEKALSDSITEQDNGDLIIEGYAAVFDGLDREGETFVPGAFERGCKAFVDNQAALCFHHKKDQVLGKVLELKETAKGLWMKARVDGAIRNHPTLGTIYQQIKSGTLNGLSVGGFFGRLGNRIADVDMTEISITGVPIHTGPKFSVIGQKALMDTKMPLAPEKEADFRNEVMKAEEQINSLIKQIDGVFSTLAALVIEGKDEEKEEEEKNDSNPEKISGTDPVTE